MSKTGTVTIRLGPREADALFDAYVRASSEWEAEDADGEDGGYDSSAPSADTQRAAERAKNKLVAAMRAKGWM